MPGKERRPGINKLCLQIQKENPKWSRDKVQAEAKRIYAMENK